MLRFIFDENRRADSGLLSESLLAIAAYENTLRKLQDKDMKPDHWLRYLQVWAQGFRRSMDELEQSLYCCKQFAALVASVNVEDMREEEADNYFRYVYFYKNALVRVFSILDKLGCFLNSLLKLETEKLKPHFNYITVLRRMHERGIALELEKKLYALEDDYQEPLKLLKARRNTEIHSLNEELVDDVEHIREIDDGKTPVEDIAGHLADLEKGFEMVCRTVITVFSSLNARG